MSVNVNSVAPARIELLGCMSFFYERVRGEKRGDGMELENETHLSV